MEVTGRNLISGLPKTITISSNETIEAMQEPLNRIMETIQRTGTYTSRTDCGHRGKRHLHDGRRIASVRFGQTIDRADKDSLLRCENAISCVAIGTGKALESIDAYSRRAVYDYRRGDYYNSNL